MSRGRSTCAAVLGAYLELDPGGVVFSLGPSKKPYLEDETLSFNLSHSTGRILLAVARGRDVGVDIEATNRARDLELMAKRVFSADEQAQLTTGATAESRERFFRGWTRKEAALKAIGTGFHRDPASLHVGLEARDLGRPWVPDSDFADFGALVDVPAPEGFMAAVAASGVGWEVVEAEA